MILWTLWHYIQSRIAPSELVDKHRYLDQSFDHNGFRPGIGVERIIMGFSDRIYTILNWTKAICRSPRPRSPRIEGISEAPKETEVASWCKNGLDEEKDRQRVAVRVYVGWGCTTCHHPHRFNELATKSEKWNGKPRLECVDGRRPLSKTPAGVLPWTRRGAGKQPSR